MTLDFAQGREQGKEMGKEMAGAGETPEPQPGQEGGQRGFVIVHTRPTYTNGLSWEHRLHFREGWGLRDGC